MPGKVKSRLLKGKVTHIDPTTYVYTFDTSAGVVRIRLPVDHAEVQQIRVGSEALLEKWVDEEGKTHYIISLPAATPEAEANLTEMDQEILEAEGSRVGVDREYFYNRQKAGHRFEIMAFLKKHLGKNDAQDDHLLEWYKVHPGRDARHTSPQQPLIHPIQQALRQTDEHYQQLYHHQAQALNAIRAGQNVVVITQTASGKTLCYNPGIFEHFLTSDPSAHALYLFPLNALLMDQKDKIDQLIRSLHSQGLDLNAELLVGGLGADFRRSVASNPPHILAANPELFSVVLNEAQNWSRFFANLRYVVVDEVHLYRGVFGMHMGGLLRRLLLHTRRYQNTPQFILSSATICNPMDLVARLTSLPVEGFCLLDETSDGSFQADKHWVVANPSYHPGRDTYDTYLNTAAHIMVELISSKDERGKNSPLNTILFAKTIREVKKLNKLVQEELKQTRPDLASKVKHYVSSDLRLDEKREIFEGLKSGKLIGVISTNALEAGIDIGKLDACIIAGFPFWVMRMRQMAGRVGRHQEGLVVYVPQDAKPMDQYYRQNPDLLLTQPPEAFVVDPDNSSIARKHVNAAAYALKGLTKEELPIFGRKAELIADAAVQRGVMQKNEDVYFGSRRNYKDTSDIYSIQGLRSNQPTPYALCLMADCSPDAGCLDQNGSKKDRCPNQITILDQPYMYRDCHPGAIYESMDGQLYEVLSLDDQKKVARAKQLPDDTLERTYVEKEIEIAITAEPYSSRTIKSGAVLYHGPVKVTRRFTGYYKYKIIPRRRCRKCNRLFGPEVEYCPNCRVKTFHYYDQTRPVRHEFPFPHSQTGFQIVLKTLACWMTVPPQMEDALQDASPCKLPGPENQVQNALQKPKPSKGLDRSLTSSELEIVEAYIQRAKLLLDGIPKDHKKLKITVFPGIYQHCLLHHLRQHMPESRALEIFAQFTGYPVTDDLKHICRKCQSSVLIAGMHTLEHTVSLRYPSVALGDQSDLDSHTTLGHPDTAQPTIFWYDTYAGGMGAAEKVFEQLETLLENSERTLNSCSCTTLEGCPNCTHLGSCDNNNEALSKPGALLLSAILQGKEAQLPFTPYFYQASRYRKEFHERTKRNERAAQEHGLGEEAPTDKAKPIFNPYGVLRVQAAVHDPVLNKVYEVRSREILQEAPPISAVELTDAYQQVLTAKRPTEWNLLPNQNPYQILEITEKASLSMISQVYRVIARCVHPDMNPTQKERANAMMQAVNAAYDQIRKSEEYMD